MWGRIVLLKNAGNVYWEYANTYDACKIISMNNIFKIKILIFKKYRYIGF